jgi:hypothetical protein
VEISKIPPKKYFMGKFNNESYEVPWVGHVDELCAVFPWVVWIRDGIFVLEERALDNHCTGCYGS